MPLPRFKQFSRCAGCGLIYPVRAMILGECWECQGKRKPPACLQDRPEKASEEPVAGPPPRGGPLSCSRAGAPANDGYGHQLREQQLRDIIGIIGERT